MPAPRRSRSTAAREGGHRPASAGEDPRPDSVRSRMRLSEPTVLKTVARLYDPPAEPKVKLPDLPLAVLPPELQAWAMHHAGDDLKRIEVHSPLSVTVHNSAAMKAKRRAERSA